MCDNFAAIICVCVNVFVCKEQEGGGHVRGCGCAWVRGMGLRLCMEMCGAVHENVWPVLSFLSLAIWYQCNLVPMQSSEGPNL